MSFPRLLRQSDIDSLKSIERQREIEEGRKLARRVDGLRQTAAEEESYLEKFRLETLAATQDEINKKIELKEGLIRETDRLLRERDEAKKPTDQDWIKIKNEDEFLKGKEIRLANIELELYDRDSEIGRKEERIEEEERRINSEWQLSNKKLIESEARERRTKELLSDANAIHERISRKRESSDRDLLERTTAVISSENALNSKQRELQEERISIDKEWRLLEDRKSMFERRIKRTKK